MSVNIFIVEAPSLGCFYSSTCQFLYHGSRPPPDPQHLFIYRRTIAPESVGPAGSWETGVRGCQSHFRDLFGIRLTPLDCQDALVLLAPPEPVAGTGAAARPALHASRPVPSRRLLVEENCGWWSGFGSNRWVYPPLPHNRVPACLLQL